MSDQPSVYQQIADMALTEYRAMQAELARCRFQRDQLLRACRGLHVMMRTMASTAPDVPAGTIHQLEQIDAFLDLIENTKSP